MPHYEVTFFKHVLSSNGHPFKAPQAAISVWADNIKEAERRAMSRFACLRGIPEWNLHADTFDVARRGTTSTGTHAKRISRSCTACHCRLSPPR